MPCSAWTTLRPVLRRPASVINKRLSPKAMLKDRVTTGEVRPVPHDLKAAMDDWAHTQRRALADNVLGSTECLDEVMERGIDVTTHYSGTGAAEMSVLLRHFADSAAEHVTQDLCTHPPPRIVVFVRRRPANLIVSASEL